VTLSSITDMTLTFETFTATAGKLETTPSPASALPTDYSAAGQYPLGSSVYWAYSQNYTRSGGVTSNTPTSPASWRKNQIFINPLIISSLPIVVANSASLQSGYSYCGEIVNTNTNVQLHTNGQAIYLAFNAASDVVKFQYENVGNANVNAGATIEVEKSADLAAWTTIQSIDISSQILSASGSGKVSVSYTLNDAAARYIRIRVAGLANSRTDRRENIRNISVLSKPVITWNQDLTGLKTTDSQVTLTASSSSSSDVNSAPVTYTSSDANVISVTDNILTVAGVGTATITAKQIANNYYSAAADVVQNVKVVDLGTGIFKVVNDAKLVYGSPKGIVSTIDGMLQVYSTTGMLLKNQIVTKNQLIPMTAGAYIVRASIAGKSISQVIVL